MCGDEISTRRRLARLALAGLLAAFAPVATAAPVKKPQRIMSVNLCTDLLLLQLVPKSRIASISFLAHQAVGAIRPGLDRGVPVNRGTAEDVVAARPDLILAADYSTPAVRRLAGRLGAPVVEVKTASDFDDIRQGLRRVGRAVGEPAKAEALIARMDARLASLARTRTPVPVPVVAWEGDTVSGTGDLTEAIMRAAGAKNLAAGWSEAGDRVFTVEQILAARPAALLQAQAAEQAPSLRAAEARHPLLARLYRGRIITYPAPLYACGLPQSADAAAALRTALEALPPGLPAP